MVPKSISKIGRIEKNNFEYFLQIFSKTELFKASQSTNLVTIETSSRTAKIIDTQKCSQTKSRFRKPYYEVCL